MRILGRTGRALLGALVAAATAVPAASWAPAACAAEGGGAALVVDTGQRVRSFCVVIGQGGVSGLDLIRLASEQHGLDYELGFGGEAVCRLDGVGVEGADCFAEFPSFWGYWRGDGSGGWRWSSVGAGSTVVEAGDVEGWSWGEGADGSTHPTPPATTAAEVCPEPEPSPVGNGSDGGGNGGSAGAGATDDGADEAGQEAFTGAEPEETTEDDRGDGDAGEDGKRSGRTEEKPQPTAEDVPAGEATPAIDAEGSAEGDRATAGSSTRSMSGPIAAVAAAGVLAGAAILLGRRRRRRSG